MLAVVSYRLPRINSDIDTLIDEFHTNIVGDYWPPERRHVDNAYSDIPFLLREIPAPSLQIEHHWTLDEFMGYLQSWSASIYFEKEINQNPVNLITVNLGKLWGSTEKRSIFVGL